MRWLFLIHVLHLWFHSNLISGDQSAADTVDKFLTALDTAASPNLDAMVELGHMQKQTGAWLKAVSSLGSFFAKGLVRQLPLPEQEAMKKLNTGYNETIANIRAIVANYRIIFNFDLIRHTYAQRVDLIMDFLNRQIQYLNDPNQPKSQAMVQQFQSLCKLDSHGSPVFALQFMKQVLVSDCRDPQKYEEELYSRSMAIFEDIKGRIKLVEDEFGAERYARKALEIQSMISSMSESTGYRFLRKLQTGTYGKFRNFEHAILAVANATKELPSNLDPVCFPRTVIETSDYSQEPTNKFVDNMRLHAQELVGIAGYCANVTFADFSNPQNITFDNIAIISYRSMAYGLYVEIQEGLLDYIPKKLNTFFPNIARQVAQRELARQDLTFWTLEKWTRAAKNVLNEIDARGHTGYEHQIHLARMDQGTTDEYYYVHNCIPDRCFYDYVDLPRLYMLVTRHMKTRRITVAAPGNLKWGVFNATIRKVVADNYNIGNLPELHKKINATIERDFFYTYEIAVYVRKFTGAFSPPAVFAFAVVGPVERTYLGESPCFQQLSYFYNATGTTRDPEHFELSFFI